MQNSATSSAQPWEAPSPEVPFHGHTADSTGLRQGSFDDRWEAAKRIPTLGETAVVELLDLLDTENLDWEIHWFAVRSLGNFDRPEVIQALIETLCTTADEDFRKTIIQALGQIGPNAIAALSHLMTHPDYRTSAIQALASIPHPATQSPLQLALAHLTPTETTLRAMIIEALGPFADVAISSVIAQALEDRSSQVRLAAIQGWIRLRRQIEPMQWISPLIPLLRDINVSVAQQAIYALSRTPDVAATAALLDQLISDTTPKTLKIAAVQALGWQATQTAVDGLSQVWYGAEEDVQAAVVQAFSRMDSPQLQASLVQHMTQWLRDLEPTSARSGLRRNLVTALAHIGGPEAHALLQSLQGDADAGVRLHVEAALRAS